MGARVLVTRPAEDAAPLIRELQARGFDALAEPLLSIRFLDDAAPDLAGVKAFAFTSANGVRALVHAVPDAPRLGVPAFAVGPATAKAARDAGFDEVLSAEGDVDALADLIIGRIGAGAGDVLHVAASRRAGDLVGRITAAGVAARRAVLYEALAADDLSREAVSAIEHGDIGWVLIFSPRTAEQFVTLMSKAGLTEKADAMCLVALSVAVANAAAPLPWGEVRMAATPNQDAVLAALGQAPEGN